MKKILLSCAISLLLPYSFAAVVSTACNAISGSSGCDACFKEEEPLYTCNSAHQNCNDKEGITLMSDIVTNTAATGNKVMYDDDEGQIYTYPLQGVTWSKSAAQLLDMFQFPAAYIQGRENFTVGPTMAWSDVSNAYVGYKLTPGSSVKWIEFKPNQWLRPDYIGNNTSRTLPALRAEFIPRLYTNATNYVDHKQCVFYYVRFCGDGTVDTNKGEQCDDGNMTNGDGCSNTCTDEPDPVCNNLTLSPTTLTNNGGNITATCTASNATGYKFILKQGNTVIQTRDYINTSTATFALPANSTASARGYTVDCYVRNANETDITSASCNESIIVPGTVPEPDPVCNNLTLSPTTLTNNGGNITATCTATNATAYKFILKRGTNVIQTRNYLNTSTATLTLPANSAINALGYTVECYVQGGGETDITSASCTESIIVPETPAVCNNLTLSQSTAQINTPINYICNATNATSYIIKQGTNIIGTLPEGTFSFSTAGTYTIGCFIDGQTNGPAACAKTVTITTPPIITNPSIFIDKDDSTPGTPDSDGNDIQRVQSNGTATFTILVRNNGNEALKTVSIEDTLAPDCARTSAQTVSLYSGGSSANFDVGESFTYQCTRNSVTSTTFPNNRNTATVKGVGVTLGTNVTDSDVSEIFMKQVNPDITIEKDDTDNLDDEQEIDEGDTAKFSVKVTNNGSEALDNINITDELSPDCDRDESETRALIREIGNDDALFDPGETFAYTCRETSVDADTFPDEINTVCTEATGVDTNGEVDDCDDTTILLNEDEDEELMCMGIDSSKGRFGGAPFRTTITCEVIDDNSCEIEVMLDGNVISTYDACSQSITFSEKGNYSVACIVDNERTSDCEMEIEVAAMTDIPTGAKILILAFLSLILTALGTHLYKREAR